MGNTSKGATRGNKPAPKKGAVAKKPRKNVAVATIPVSVESPKAVPAAKKTKLTATYNGKTESRTTHRAYTHAAVYRTNSGNVIGSWHGSEAAARKGVNGRKPIAVVPVKR